jgi:hypothetical protein
MKLIVAALALTIASTGHAAEFSINSGNYGEHNHFYPAYGETAPFRIQMDGSKLVVTEVKNNLIYEIDISNAGEQLIQPKLLEHLRTLSGARTIANLINRITISGLSTDDQGVLHGTFNIYLSTQSVFGSVHAKLTVGAEVANKPCSIERDDGFNQKTYQRLSTVYTGSCINADLGTSFGLQSLSATMATGKEFSSEVMSAIGMTADMIFKFYSPVMTGLISLYEQR